MEINQKKLNSIEWAIRILLTIQFYTVISGYIAYAQTSYQLDTPVIPRSIIDQIASPYWKVSLMVAGPFLICLWAYFLRKRLFAIIFSSVSIVGFYMLLQLVM